MYAGQRSEIFDRGIFPSDLKKVDAAVLTSIGIIILIVRSQQNVVLASLGLLLGEVLVLDLGKLDHREGCVWERL